MNNSPTKTTIEIYWQSTAFPNSEALGLYTMMKLRGFLRKERINAAGPDLWVQEKAETVESWRWLESICKQYRANAYYIRPEYL